MKGGKKMKVRNDWPPIHSMFWFCDTEDGE